MCVSLIFFHALFFITVATVAVFVVVLLHRHHFRYLVCRHLPVFLSVFFFSVVFFKSLILLFRKKFTASCYYV